MIEHYKSATKFAKGQEYFNALYRSGNLSSCSPGMISGYCQDGHKFLQSLHCGREYCPDCGRDGSPIHARRFNRWMPKVRNMAVVGYLVVTVPQSLRADFHNKELLSAFRMLLKKKLVRMGFRRGLMRWHYFGDCKSCNGDGCETCEHTGAGRKWNPHLNILIEQGYVNDLENSTFRKELNEWLYQFFNRLNGGGMVKGKENFNFSYVTGDLNIIHVVKYITRSTFRIYNAATAKELYRFRSTSSWGKFVESFTPDEAIDNGCCPLCKAKEKHNGLIWTKLNSTIQYNNKKTIHLKNGNYYVIETKNNGGNLAFGAIGTTIKKRERRALAASFRQPGYNAVNYLQRSNKVVSK